MKFAPILIRFYGKLHEIAKHLGKCFVSRNELRIEKIEHERLLESQRASNWKLKGADARHEILKGDETLRSQMQEDDRRHLT